MELQDSNPKYTPGDKEHFHKDLGAPCAEDCNYRLITGMMLHLARSIQPDIAFVVNQCDHFSHAPKRFFMPPSEVMKWVSNMSQGISREHVSKAWL